MTDTTERLAPHAVERLKGLRGQGSHAGIFTSDLSVNEFVMVRKAGFEPLGLVIGSCIYHMGVQYGSWSRNMEMEVLSQAMYEARELAISRMEQEASLLQADGIVGVRLEVKRMEWDDQVLEFMAIGTAIAHRTGAQGFKGVGGKPFTSDLSGQDFWMLLQAGYRPMEMVMGSCVYHVAHQGFMKSLANAGRNVELDQFTQAMYDARELAMERMQHEAQAAQADGITGVQLKEGSHNWQPHVIEFFSVGTAVKAMDNADQIVDALQPQLVLPIDA
ncbi:heavy metal-binding domain-containing protein [Thiomonas sp.]